MFGYVSFAQLSDAIRGRLYEIPADVDLIVGIPRSGMVPAYQIGLFLNRLVCDIDSFIADGTIGHGHTRKLAVELTSLRQARHLLLVDDSIASGSSMQKALAGVRESGYTGRVSTCAAIVAPSHKRSVDVSFITLPQPRLFEWNAFHHACVENACFDLDGVLCVDPTTHDNDDGPRYEKFLANARPLFRPTLRIGHIVSARLEKYRTLTEDWLAAHNISYGKLHLVDLPSKAERIRLGAHCSHKIRLYRETHASMFYESDLGQAREIATGSGKPVLCIADMTMVMPGAANVAATAKSALWKLRAPLGLAKGWVKQQLRSSRTPVSGS
ncbi:MAG TPA: phosphoribosyltransferase family protein [Steroidobacter sp.]|uniref:phosphoribosyltransferase family protein n=1 Tax=Steroidobacter sp. TaxID=1978227 RepID=UPI002EDBA630